MYRYVPGSCTISEVALLNARAMYLREDESDEVGEYSEFQAEGDHERELPIGAQLDVLYEISHTFEPISSPLDEEVSTDNTNEKGETKITALGVAIMEGYLQGGPTNELKWKIAMLREASEFPMFPSTTVTSP
jgi:hypothetical protein